MVDLSPGALSRKARTKGGLVTIVTVTSLIAAMGLTWLGLSADDHVSADFDAESWLWSTSQGELARVNGITAKVDTRQAVPDSKGHQIQLSQSDRYLILRDLSTGKVSAFDPATLAITSTMDTQQGLGITIALRNDAAFVVDAVQGVVRQLDPATLQPIGDPLRFPPGITGGSFDGKGRLWIAVPSEGTVTAITPAPVARGGGAGQGGGGPSQVRTDAVAEPWHDLALSALDDGVAVLDQTNGKLVTLRGDALTTVITDAAGGELPTRSGGDVVPVTVVEGRHVYVISGGGTNVKITDFTVPGEGRLQPAVAWAGRIYVADEASGKVYSLDREGKPAGTITFKTPGPLQLEVRENHLFINSPGSSIAQVVNDKHEVREVDKFRNEIVGGDPIAPPPDPKPVVTKPGPPKNIKAAAGDNQVTLTWGKAPENGSRIIKYIVTGNGQTWEVGANQRSLIIPGLVNGTSYQFSVKAVNGHGAGPEGKSNKVIPTRDVPDPPTDVRATANPDGTVTLTWTAANGQGRKIVRYEVTAISAGAGAPVAENDGKNTITIAAGELAYGTQYAFTVVTVNDIGGGSKVSTPVSNTVVPFNKPGPPKNLRGLTSTAQRGAVEVRWQAAEDNGRPLTGYEVTAKGRTQTVAGTATNAVLNGFAEGEIVTIEVLAANLAGKGPKLSTTAKTLAVPTISNVRHDSPVWTQVMLRFAINDGGGGVTCHVLVNGGEIEIPCGGGAGGTPLAGLKANQDYSFSIRIRNPAGSAQSGQFSIRTPVLNGTVTCIRQPGDSYCSGGIGVYSNARQQRSEGRGDVYNGAGFRAICWIQGSDGDQSASATLNAVQYNNYKTSSTWIKIPFRGENYIPWVWFNLEAHDTEAELRKALPPC